MALEKGPSTKDRLASIVQGFDDFDTEMKTGTRVGLFSEQVVCLFSPFCAAGPKGKGRV